MSAEPTKITQDIYKYILKNFSAEDDFLANLTKEARAWGIPEIQISPDQGHFIQFLVKLIDAGHILEIGSLAGYSAIITARAMPESGKLIALEKDPNFANFIRGKVQEAGLENLVDVHAKPALEFLHSFKPEKPLDFVFIDADKTEYVEYFKYVDPLLRPGGIIAADNALAFGDVAKNYEDIEEPLNVEGIQIYNEYVIKREDYFSTLVTIGDGLLLSQKKRR